MDAMKAGEGILGRTAVIVSILVGVVTVAASIYDRIPAKVPTPDRAGYTLPDTGGEPMRSAPAGLHALPVAQPVAEAAGRGGGQASSSQSPGTDSGGAAPDARRVAPSFPCDSIDHAYQPVELAICNSDALALADRALATAYAEARRRADPRQKTTLRTLQRDWMSSRSACTDDDCLLAMYQQRTAELSGLHR